MPLSAAALAELGLELAKGVFEGADRSVDAQGRTPDHPDYDPFEDTEEEKAEFERQLAARRANRKEYLGRVKPKPIDPMKVVSQGIPEGKSASHTAQVSERKKPADHNARTKKLLEGMGFVYYRADHHDARTGRSHDLMGVFDGLAFGSDGVVGVQLTSKANMAARKRKLQKWEHLGAWKDGAGAQVLVVGWEKDGGKYKESLEWL